MPILAGIAGAFLIVIILWDAFESIVLPRRVMRKWRLARGFYRATWKVWSSAAARFAAGKKRESYLSFFGPLSLLMLLGVWATGIVIGFGTIMWSLGSPVAGHGLGRGFLWDLYYSGSTFFTLGMGDLTPQSGAARLVSVLECGLGLGFLAMVIGYLPVIYQAFSRRESDITLLDARAGSPSAAVELLIRHAKSGDFAQTSTEFFSHWERWSSELLESHLSYPVLAYYRSQHDNQSWLGALTTVLDASAVVVAGLDGRVAWQAQLTFAMARHAIVDLSQVFGAAPEGPAQDRLPHGDVRRAVEILMGAGIAIDTSADGGEFFERKLADLRRMYEPYVNSLSKRLIMSLPPWLPMPKRKENWLTSAWEHATTPESAISSELRPERRGSR